MDGHHQAHVVDKVLLEVRVLAVEVREKSLVHLRMQLLHSRLPKKGAWKRCEAASAKERAETGNSGSIGGCEMKGREQKEQECGQCARAKYGWLLRTREKVARPNNTGRSSPISEMSRLAARIMISLTWFSREFFRKNLEKKVQRSGCKRETYIQREYPCEQ